MLKKFFAGVGVLLLALGVFAYAGSGSVFAQSDSDFELEYDFGDTTMDSEWETSYDMNSSVNPETERMIALITSGVGLIFSLVFGVGGYIYMALSLSTIGKKLGYEENSWMAWVPIVQYFYIFMLGDKSPWLALLMFIPCVNIIGLVLMLIAWMEIAGKRGFPKWVGLLLLVPVVGIFVPGYVAWAEPN